MIRKKIKFFRGESQGSPFCFRKKQNAFSLLEVIMVIALIAVTYALVLPDLTMLESTAVSNKLHRLASDIRSAYDLAVLANKPHRLVFDPIKGDYWIEFTDQENFLLDMKDGGEDLSAEEEQDRREAFEEGFVEYEDIANQEVSVDKFDEPVVFTSPLVMAKNRLMPATWTKVSSSEWKGRSLGPELIIQSMQAEHHASLQQFDQNAENTRFFLYFFPSGYVEKSFFHIYYRTAEDYPDEERVPYTLTTDPYKGVADYQTGRIEVNLADDEA